MQPEIIGTVCLWLGGTQRCHGNGAPYGSVGSGDWAWVSSFWTYAITSAGSTTKRPDASFLIIEKFVGRGWVFSSSTAVRRMDCKATFDFLGHTEEGLSILEPALVVGVFEKKASGSPVRFKACAQAVVELWRRCGVVIVFGLICSAKCLYVPDRGECHCSEG